MVAAWRRACSACNLLRVMAGESYVDIGGEFVLMTCQAVEHDPEKRFARACANLFFSETNMSLRTFNEEEIEKHNSADDCWVVVDGEVYDVTKFLDEHPGGKKILLKEAGKDASKVFHKFHDAAAVLRKYVRFYIDFYHLPDLTESVFFHQ